MIEFSGSFSYIRPDSKGKPYTFNVSFTSSFLEGKDVIAVMVQTVDEESGFQEIDNYIISELVIGVWKDHRFKPIESEVLNELKEMVLSRYKADNLLLRGDTSSNS